MVSEKQIKANRQNAQNSTGPKTAEGKTAVSKNAVKHGLFAEEAIVTGENPADYEAYLDSFLTELKPVGAVETMLAERFVSLSWRLMRAQRMQNQVIENFIERHVTNPLPRRTRVLTCHAQGIPLGDPRCTSSHLPLGRISTSDWSCCRVLERMFIYEKRIESSMTKILNELKRQQIMRRIEQQDIDSQHEPPPSLRDEAATRSQLERSGDLKKQSQFVPGLMDISPFSLNGYGDLSAAGHDENKPNKACPERSRMGQFDYPLLPKRLLKRDKTSMAANRTSG